MISNLTEPMVGNVSCQFSKKLTKVLFLRRREATRRQDNVTIQTLDVLIEGLTEVMKASQGNGDGKTDNVPRFSTASYRIFFDLVVAPNNSRNLVLAGTHYLVEWSLPKPALDHFKRALNLSCADKSLPLLIEIATLVITLKTQAGTQGRPVAKALLFPKTLGQIRL